ncbi:MAG: polysaccharide export protein [Nevskiaceae bacterium]|jgi:polysaccharide export outer membrane protein|nr:polysaccharide export protein [Nevskiaceae bacterium]
MTNRLVGFRVAVLALLCWTAGAWAADAAPTAALADQPPPMQSADDYVIGPGDSLQIFVWRNPELSVTVPVRPDGKISTPLVENMVAVGKSPSQLARDVEVVLSEFVRTPQVNVIVDKAASTFSQVKVVGQVRTPQAVPYREGLRVLDVVLATGGLTDFAAPNRARVVREVNGKSVETPVKLGALLNNGDLSQNLELKPGDVLIIPQSRF